MTGGKFFPKLSVDKDGVVLARGPLEGLPDQVVEMCVWVYQRSANGSDAIANMMKDGDGLKKKPKMDKGMADESGGLKVERSDTNELFWSLDLTDRMNGKAKFTKGSATAVAIGVFIDDEKHERLFLWSEPVMLQGAGVNSSSASAKRATAKRANAKRTPAKRAPAKPMNMKKG